MFVYILIYIAIVYFRGLALLTEGYSQGGCHFILREPEGYLLSPNYPYSYLPGSECRYDIARTSHQLCGVKIFVEELNLAQGYSNDHCTMDWLSMESCVPQGGNRLCGNLSRIALQYMFQPGSKAVRFVFHSSKDGVHTEAYRFRIRYRVMKLCRGQFVEPFVSQIHGDARNGMCHARITDKKGAINTPYYPGHYPNNLDCLYEFIRPNPFVCGVRMTSLKFQLEPVRRTSFGGACSDYFQTPGCGFLCDSITFTWISVYQPGATSQEFHFHSDETRTSNGFLIKYEQIYHC